MVSRARARMRGVIWKDRRAHFECNLKRGIMHHAACVMEFGKNARPVISRLLLAKIEQIALL